MLTNAVHNALLALLAIAPGQELIHYTHALQRKDDAPYAERPPVDTGQTTLQLAQASCAYRHERTRRDFQHTKDVRTCKCWLPDLCSHWHLIREIPSSVLQQASPSEAHPAGVSGVGCRALTSAFVGPKSPNAEPTLTKIRAA